ncbi:hypothetical protein LCGC14_0181980 [marine sediment metagenome]|uniref:Peptidase C-terminal archaeal/bacterial domain-containing protein n=1 Tax=marine sediment metagenome TaxID=412755 RepID=A0A0F9UTV4_9ZZZZ|nr:hypothetical protein [Phycisphaerae bacterium]
MRDRLRIVIPTCLFAGLFCAHAAAQPQPHVGYVYPAGGRQDATFEVAVGGLRLAKVNDIIITGEGVEAEIVEYIEPPWKTWRRLRKLKNKLDAAEKEHASPDGDDEELPSREELMKMLKDLRKSRNPKAQINPQIQDTVRVRITIAKDAPLGEREIRLITPAGTSNPALFHVGQLPEVVEPKATQKRSPPMALPALPVLLNGQVLPGEVDRFRFKASKGQHLVFRVEARALIPYLADAVPGWFQVIVTVYDAEGNEVAFADDYQFSPDPVLFYDVPKDGEYTLEIKDSIYRGRRDFVYRIAIGELPFVTGIFPLGGASGAKTTVEVVGKNLPVDHLEINAPAGAVDIQWVAVRKGGGSSNGVPFAVGDLPEAREAEPNSDLRSAQNVSLGVIVNGRIEQPGDWDVFSFEGKAGQKIVAEVHARRLNSPLDSVLKLTDGAGGVLQANDDKEDKGAGLTTHHADSYLIFDLPVDGTYFVHLGDVQNQGSRLHAYRLRISPARPDFALRVVPSAIHIPRGGIAPLTVHVLRKDGFSGEIRLAVKDMPEALAISGVIPANEDKVHLTMTASKDVALGRMTPQLEAVATIDGKSVRHDAVPADEMMQAFLYKHLVPAQELIVAVTKPVRVSLKADLPAGESLKVPAGGTVELVIEGNRRAGRARQFKLALADAPEGITVEDVAIEAGNKGAVLVVRADGEHLKPGRKGNLIVALMVGKNRRRICIAPAIPFEIVE